MPDSPLLLVARFLQANNYDETLSTLLSEAQLPPDAGVAGPDDLTVEKVLEEKRIFDLSLRFEKVAVGDPTREWRDGPATARQLGLTSSSNVLYVGLHDLAGQAENQVLLASTADRRLYVLNAEGESFSAEEAPFSTHDSPILSCEVLFRRWAVCAGMSGRVSLLEMPSATEVDSVRDHGKYVVKVAVHHEDDEEGKSALVATAGWDAKVFLYRCYASQGDQKHPVLGEPIGSINLDSNPECLLFAPHPGGVVLIVSRRDSTFLSFYAVPSKITTGASPLNFVGRQNLAPHSNAWIAFSPAWMALSPVEPGLLAVATSSIPHMKLLLVRLLLTALDGSEIADKQAATQAEQTRAALRRADREADAIVSHTSTLAPQTPYSTPQVTWRPNGSGVWVNGDDGVLRGVDRTGKIKQVLKDGHEAGSKIRCLCTGISGDGKEVLVSGGFDHNLLVWT